MSTNRHMSEIKRIGTSRLGVIVALVMLLLVILILTHSRSQSRNIVSPIEILLGAPEGLSGDVAVFSQGDVTVYMPPGATELDGIISIAAAEPSLSLLVDDSGWIPIKVVNLEFRSMEGVPVVGVTFSRPLEICFTLADELWQVLTQNPEAYRIQYFADQKHPSHWESLPQVTYPDRSQLCGQTQQLSLFALAFQKEVGIPVTGLITVYSPIATRNRERRESARSDNANVLQVIPTNPPTGDVTLVQPQLANPPAVEPPVQKDKQKDEEQKKEKNEEIKKDEKNKDENKKEKKKKQ